MATQIARRLVILGAPGSGKGTIAARIVKTYGMPHIVVGDLLRQHIQRKSGIYIFSSLLLSLLLSSRCTCTFLLSDYMIVCISFDFIFTIFAEESKTIKEHIDKGLLLPDDLVLKFVAGELNKIRDKGFLLDGRTTYRQTREVYAIDVLIQAIHEHSIKHNYCMTR
jgi:adenylate kinase family enzyme